jgi:hypothetical protein
MGGRLELRSGPPCSNLSNLTPEEMTLYDDLRRDRHGPGVRLEQERVSLQIAKDLLDDI